MEKKYKHRQQYYLLIILMLLSIASIAAPHKKYWMAPTITNVSPANACVGETIDLTGTNLATVTEVSINGVTVMATDFVSQTGANIEVEVPVGSEGIGTISATNPNGTDTHGSSFISVALPSGIPSITTPNGTEFCEGDEVIIEANGTLSTNEAYQWYEDAIEMTGENASTLTVSNAATYTLTIKNVLTNCETAISGGVMITENPMPSGTPSITTPNGTEFCEGDTLEITASGTLGVNEAYQWFQDGAEITGETASTLEVLEEGDYALTIRNTITGCETTLSLDVFILENLLPSQPVITAAGATTFCNGNEVVLVGPTGFSNYYWLLDGALTGANASSITVSVAGDYTLVVDDGDCESPESATVTITVNDNPIADAGTPVTICEGQSVTLNASATDGDGTYTYAWSPTDSLSDATIHNPVANPSFTTTYTVTVTDGNSCVDTDDVLITVNDNPTINLVSSDFDNIICESDSITFTATGPVGTQYQFFVNNIPQGVASTINTLTTDALGVGNRAIKVEGTFNGCTVTTQDLNVTVNALTPVSILNPTQTTYTTETDTVILVGDPAGGVFSGPGIVNDVFFVNLVGLGGPYTITYTYTNANGCESVVTHDIEIRDVSAILLDETYCADAANVVLTNSDVPNSPGLGISPTTHELIRLRNITDGTGIFPLVAGAASYTFSPSALDPGTYIIEAIYREIGTVRLSRFEQKVTINEVPDISFEGLDAAYCYSNVSIDLKASESTGTFAWTGVTSGASNFNPTLDLTISGDPLADTIHTVALTYTDANNCSNDTSQTITIHGLPDVDFTGLAAEYCFSTSDVVLTSTQGGGVFVGAGISDNNDGTAIFSPRTAFLTLESDSTIALSTDFDIVHTYTDINGCTDSTTQAVEVNELPNVAIDKAAPGPGPLETVFCYDDDIYGLRGVPSLGVGETGVFSGNGVIDLGGGFGGFNPSDAADAAGVTSATDQTTIHIVTYTYTNAAGCINTSTIEMIVNKLPEVSFTGVNTAAAYCHNDDPVLLTSDSIPDDLSTFGEYEVLRMGGNATNAIFDNEDGTAEFFPDEATFDVGADEVGGITTRHQVVYTYEDANGCQNSFIDTILVYSLPDVSITGVDDFDEFCYGDPTITLTGLPTSSNGLFDGFGITDNGDGTAGYDADSAAIQSGETSPTFPGQIVEDVVYEYTDANNCTNETSLTLIVNALPRVEITGLDDSYCFDEEESTLRGIANPPTGLSESFSGNGIFDFGDGTADFDPESAANDAGITEDTAGPSTHIISYTFTDFNGCTNVVHDTTVVTPLPIVSFTGLDDKRFCVDDTAVTLLGSPVGDEFITFGAFFINGINDDTNDSQVLFTPQIAYNASVASGDSVAEVEVVYAYADSLGCENFIIDTATIFDKPTVFFSGYNAARTYCVNDDSFVLTGRTPEGNPVTFFGEGIETDNGDGTAIYNPSLVFDNLGLDSLKDTGRDEVKYAFTDSNGCTDTATVMLTIRPLSGITNFDDTAVCYGEILTLRPAPSSGLFTAFTGDGISDNGNGTATFDAEIAAIAAGATSSTDQITTHNVRYTYTNNDGCTNAKDITVTVNPLPIISFTGLGDKEFCIEEPAIDIVGTPLADNSTTFGKFTIVGIPDDVEDSQIEFDPTRAYNATAQTGDSVVKVFVTFEYTDVLGCENSVIDSVIIHDRPTVFFSGFNASRTYCMNDAEINLVGRSPEGNPVSFIGNGIIQDNGDGTAVYSPRQGLINLGLDSLSDTGIDKVRYAYTDIHGCVDTANIDVTIRPLTAIANFNDDVVCYGDSILLEPVPTNGMFTGFTGRGITDLGNSTAIFDGEAAALLAGITDPTSGSTTHDIIYTFTNNNGCTNTKTIEMTVQPLPAVSFSNLDQEYCYDNPTVTLAGNPLGVTGRFTGNGIALDFLNGTATYSPIVASQRLGASNSTDFAVTDTVTYTFTDDNGCINSIADTVRINPLPEVSIVGSNGAYCYNVDADTLIGIPAVTSGTAGLFSGEGITDSPTGLVPENGDGQALFLPELAATQAGFSSGTQVTNHEVFYTYTDGNGCTNVASEFIRVNPLPVTNITSAFTNFCYDATPVIVTTNQNDTTGIRSAVISGRGITDFGDGSAEFSPTAAAIEAGIIDPTGGNSTHSITFTYTDGNGCINQDATTHTVLALPDISFSLDNNGLNDQKEYCPTTSTFNLRSNLPESSNTEASFTGEGVGDFDNGLGTFNPNLAVTASGRNPLLNNTDTTQHIIRLFYRDGNLCENEAFDTLTVNPSPRATFNVLNNCGTSPIDFEGNALTNTTITDWEWDFGDNTLSTAQNTSHLFSPSGIYDVKLSVITDKGCEDDTIRQVQVGGKPIADFNFIRICFNDSVFFTDQSTVSNLAIDTITNWNWSFDDPAGSGSANTIQNPFHIYSDTGTYDIQLEIITNNGCRDTVTKIIDILPVVAISNFPYSESFEAGDGSWVAGGDNSSWEHGIPLGDTIDFTPAGTQVWMTNLDSSYNTEERSYVDGPCFDFSTLERPMISMKVWTDTDPSRDGAVLQYSEDDGITWNTIGDLTSPYNWYDQNIASQPGGSASGNAAWTGRDENWRTARHELDNLKGKAIRLRVAFGSDAAEDETDGFAFDEVWIGERSKTVLVEHFTNSSTAADASSNPIVNTAVNQFSTDDVVAIQYHLESDAGSVPDPFNIYNPTDPSARALYYGLSETPNTVIDGVIFEQSSVTANVLRALTLGDPTLLGTSAFTLDVSFEDLPRETLNVRAELTANTPITGEVLVHFAVIERVVTLASPTANGETRFEWVMKKMLPNAAGTSFDRDWLPGDTETVTESWQLLDIDNPDQIAVVAFVQQNNTSGGGSKNLEVYQSAYAEPSVVPPVLITGLEDQLPEALQKAVLYPNPANDRLFVVFGGDVSENYDWQVYNNLGQVMENGTVRKGSNGFVVNTQELPQGIYFVRVGTPNAQLVRKVVVTH